MTVPSGAVLPQLGAPPIVEVACGVLFEQRLELDPLLLGVYWHQRSDKFPKRQFQPALLEPGETIILFPGPPLRVMLETATGDFILQLQPSRFYLNWRGQGGVYPRFSQHGEEPGLLRRALDEYTRFDAFCRETLGAPLVPRRIELTKVDDLVEGRHWSGGPDLAKLVPWLKPFVDFSEAAEPNVTLRFVEPREGGQLAVSLTMLPGESGQRRLRLQTTLVRVAPPDLEGIEHAFVKANQEVNRVFARLLNDEERDLRFERRGS